ncbi:molybdate ABC transporter substrate-binding protein [uncultured Xylophilus sp.]|uniref:molybdate ABC transporter substrate-binding protein n=1 Tax=uncultured Xylophilus sp. TaxID=296832 RepID=UPI0025E24EA7|nr:molybdate ABC transporter substrate-binding protein [uncultured Xylophilus sp.]
MPSLRFLLPLRAVAACAGLLLASGLHAQEIVVSAAASLTNAFQEMGQAFSRSRPQARVTFNFAASGALLAQIRQGAPVDVFASADQATMDRAAAENLLAPGSRADFAANDLVLVVPAAATAFPARIADLTQPAYRRIAVGTAASVPAGRYAADAVEAAGLAPALAPKWIYGESVRQVLNYVARGEVEAGFVYRTDALQDAGKVRVAATVPTRTPVRYPIAVLAASRQPAVAADFAAFVRSPAGQDILARHGFSRP